MIDIKVGSIVFSLAGHDKNKYYVVSKLCGDKTFIVDGRRRKLEKPKMKNKLHLKLTNYYYDGDNFTDKGIRDYLAKLRGSECV